MVIFKKKNPGVSGLMSIFKVTVLITLWLYASYIYFVFVFLILVALSFHSKLCCCSVRHACETKTYWKLKPPYFNQPRFLLHEAKCLQLLVYEIKVLRTAVGIVRFSTAFSDQATTFNSHDWNEVHFCMI